MRMWLGVLGVGFLIGLFANVVRAQDESTDKTPVPVRIRIFISSDNQILVDGEIVPEAKVEDHLRGLMEAETRVKVRVRIKAHADAPQGTVLKVAAAARNAGYLDVTFEQPEKDLTPTQLIVVVPRQGNLAVNDIPVAREELTQYVQKLIPDAERRKRVPVLLYSRRDVPYGDLAAVAKEFHAAGFGQVQIKRIQN